MLFSADITVDQFLSQLSPSSAFRNMSHHLGPNLHLHPSNATIKFSCRKLFNAALSTANSSWPPPKDIPPGLENQYTFNGVIPVEKLYFAERQNGGAGYTWTEELINEKSKQKCTCGGYRQPECERTITKHADFIFNKTGYVFGSQTPWAEAALIAAGASMVTTVEYMIINSTHPKLKTFHPSEIAKMYLDNLIQPVDFVWSYSSFEHDGLGRYGDIINPFGDMECIARVHCLLKTDGVLFLGLESGKEDKLIWNAHRVYGPRRWKLILSNWKLLDIIGFPFQGQPILVLQKVLGEDRGSHGHLRRPEISHTGRVHHG